MKEGKEGKDMICLPDAPVLLMWRSRYLAPDASPHLSVVSVTTISHSRINVLWVPIALASAILGHDTSSSRQIGRQQRQRHISFSAIQYDDAITFPRRSSRHTASYTCGCLCPNRSRLVAAVIRRTEYTFVDCSFRYECGITRTSHREGRGREG